MRAGRPRSQARPPRRCRADHSRKNGRSLMKMNHQWTRINTNGPEDRWTCLNHKGRQDASAILCSCACTNSLPGSAGVPPAPSPAQPRPSPPLGSTWNGAMALLRPGRCGSRRQGGCLQHCTEAQRQPKGQHAGGTPALPGKAVPADRVGCLRHRTEAQRRPKGQHAGGTPALPGKAKTGNMVYTFHQCINHSLRGSSWITLFSPSRPLADPYRSSSNPFVDIFFLSEARPRYFSPDGTRRMRGERLKEP